MPAPIHDDCRHSVDSVSVGDVGLCAMDHATNAGHSTSGERRSGSLGASTRSPATGHLTSQVCGAGNRGAISGPSRPT